MFVKLDKTKQKELINSAVKKAGSYRRLANILNMSKTALHKYSNSEMIHKDKFEKIANFVIINNKESLILEQFKDNYKQKIGGKKCVESKIKKGTFKRDLLKAQQNGALKLKEWHRLMKKNNPKEYYLIQYSKFKKVGEYKYR